MLDDVWYWNFLGFFYSYFYFYLYFESLHLDNGQKKLKITVHKIILFFFIKRWIALPFLLMKIVLISHYLVNLPTSFRNDLKDQLCVQKVPKSHHAWTLVEYDSLVSSGQAFCRPYLRHSAKNKNTVVRTKEERNHNQIFLK